MHNALDRLIQKVTRRALRQAALDLEYDSSAERERLVQFVTRLAPTMDDASVAYGFYVANTITGPEVQGLKQNLTGTYRARLLKWFEYAIKKRAAAGGGGVGLKRLKDGVAAFIEELPVLVVQGYKPMTAFIQGNISEVIDGKKINAVGARIYRVLVGDFRSVGLQRTAKADLEVKWDPEIRLWFIPPTPATYPLKDKIIRAGFRWDPALSRWEALKITPAMEALVEVPQSAPPLPDQAGISTWFFETWLPVNIQRFDKVFNEFLKSKESSYQFKFALKGRKVTVDMARKITGPRDAVEELRHRYIGRRGREAWLEVLDRYGDLHQTTSGTQVTLLIDRMNNLQHSNGLFIEQFPTSVRNWYVKFLDRKYSARDPWILAAFIPDADLREVLQFYAPSEGVRPRVQGDPDIEIIQKDLPKGTNWREKGYPYNPGVKQPSRFDPAVQRNLKHMPGAWSTD